MKDIIDIDTEQSMEEAALRKKLTKILSDLNDNDFIAMRLGVKIEEISTYNYAELKNLENNLMMLFG